MDIHLAKVNKMSKNLNKSQLLTCELLAFGHTVKEISKMLNIRSETISRWKKNYLFNHTIEEFQGIFLKQIIDKQVNLLQCSQTAILDIFDNDKVSYEFKANIGIKFLNLYGGSFSLFDRLENSYNSKVIGNKDSDKVLKKILSIIEGISKIERFGDKFSDQEYRAKVKEILDLTKIDESKS